MQETVRNDGSREDPYRMEPILLEQWLLDAVSGQFSKRLMFGLVAILAVGLLSVIGIFGNDVWRIAATEKTLKDMHAEYAWFYQTRYLTDEEPPAWAREKWAKKLGEPLVSDISLVKIQEGHPDDSQLSFLENLRDLRAFELRSHLATDKTLAVISKLPRLQYLTLIGRNFSIMGLLQLRQAPCLTTIRVDTQQYSPIELAVLRAELPGVKILNARPEMYEPYPNYQGGFAPAA